MPKCDILLLVIGMELKAYRIDLGITAKEASVASNVPLRTYIRYENDDKYGNILKRKQILFALQEKYGVSEEKGVLSVEKIKENCFYYYNRLLTKGKCCVISIQRRSSILLFVWQLC